MSLRDLEEQICRLPVQERLRLVSTIIQSLQSSSQGEDWQYLVARPHPWRRQLYVKGHKLPAATVWQDMIVNGMPPEQVAENWNLPLPAVDEIIRYCESHQDLLKLEAQEERYHLEDKGMSLEPTTTVR